MRHWSMARVPTPPGEWVQGGDAVPYGPVDNHDSFHDWQKVKLHAHYQQQDFNAWLRYTQGEKLTWENKTIYNYTLPVTGVPQSAYGINGVGYKQLTLDLSTLDPQLPAMVRVEGWL